MRAARLVLLAALVLWTAVAAAAPLPMRHGVVFLCPEQPEEAVRQLELIQGSGFDLIKFGSWVWTLPQPGSGLEQRAQAVLDWCDRHHMAFFLMHNIQFGNAAEGGGLNDQVLDPRQALPLLQDWARVLRGHPSVLGVILGNEVVPSLGTPEQAPALWAQFRDWLAQQHGTIAALNQAWDDTSYQSFAEVGLPPGGSPGWADYRAFANQVFARFYGELFDGAFRPVLGEKLYGCKTSLDPFLHRACQRLSIACWDDLVAMHPLWQLKCAADTTGKPLFNAELHLYHEFFQFMPSAARSRYRYLMSALLGEYMTASFAWGQWQSPDIQDIHAHTPGILAELRRLEPYCRALATAYQQADLAVLVTDTNYHHQGEGVENPLARLYAQMAALGRPWRYLLDADLGTLRGGTLVVWTAGLTPAAARALAALPPAVRVISLDAVPYRDQYDRLLPAELQGALRRRAQVVARAELARALPPPSGLPPHFQKVGGARYTWWSAARGHYSYGVPYCPLEVRWTGYRGGRLVAVVNNYELPQTAPLPWAGPGTRTVDLASGRLLTPREASHLYFAPLDVRLFLLTRQ